MPERYIGRVSDLAQVSNPVLDEAYCVSSMRKKVVTRGINLVL